MMSELRITVVVRLVAITVLMIAIKQLKVMEVNNYYSGFVWGRSKSDDSMYCYALVESEIVCYMLTEAFFLNAFIPSCSEIAAMHRIPVGLLSVILNENFGSDDIGQIVIQLKIALSEELLMEGLSIIEVSSKCKFPHVFSFIWHFKRIQRVFPWTWRNKML